MTRNQIKINMSEEKKPAKVAWWFTYLVFPLLRVTNWHDMELRLLQIVSNSVVPSGFIFEMATWYIFYYQRGQGFSEEAQINFTICIVLDAMIVWCHVKAMQDPGYIKNLEPLPKTANQLKEESFCKQCKCIKTKQTHHCSKCNKCVFLMDHHCLWTNNCMGYNSLKPFFLFNMYVCLLCIFGLFTIVHNISLVLEEDYGLGLVEGILWFVLSFRIWNQNAFKGIGLLVLVYGSAAFFAFAVSMVFSGVNNLKMNHSMVDQIKQLTLQKQGLYRQTQGQPKRGYLQVAVMIFGTQSFSFLWLFPINQRPKLTMQMVIEAEKAMYDQNHVTVVQACDKAFVTVN